LVEIKEVVLEACDMDSEHDAIKIRVNSLIHSIFLYFIHQ
jgi:hypothetical protein